MEFLKRIAVLFIVTIMMYLSCLLLLLSLQLIEAERMAYILTTLFHDQQTRIVMGGVSSFLILINFIFYRLFSVNVHRDKIIAFDNPGGRVSVSLVAMEDLIKRMLYRVAEIKDVRSIIKASSKGLDIKVKLILRSEGNIPEIASRVQTQVLRKIQDTIGLDEPVNVSVYVGKIISESVKNRQSSNADESSDKGTPNIPYHGYRP